MAKICIIGAGVSGLTTIKQLLDEGHEPYCYERSPDMGGLFNFEMFNNKKGSVYKNTVLTISNYHMAFSDFPPKEKERIHWHHNQYLNYLRDYSNTYNLQRFIKYNSEVTSVEQNGDKWKVTTKCLKKGQETSEIFDGVAICTGTHQIPNIPNFNGKDKFNGKILHSSEYKDNSDFKDKNVIVIGIGESSADIVREISNVASSCHLVIRNYPAIVPRNQQCEASDSITSRALSISAYPKSKVLQIYLLFCVIVANIEKSISRKLNIDNEPELDSFCQSTDINFIDHSLEGSDEVIKLVKAWNILSGATGDNKFLTKNATFVKNIVNNKINVIKGEIDYFVSNGIITKNGNFVECDTVMLCTGYKDKFDFIRGYRIEDNNVRNLYLNAFHPKMNNVAFIGWNRPSSGAIPACSEMIARYFALLISGKKKLPQNIEFLIKKNKKQSEERFKYSPNILTVIDYHNFMTEVAGLIGCNVQWSKYLLKPNILYKLVFGGHISAQYRLNGPHSMKKTAEESIRKLRISPVIEKASLKVALSHVFGSRMQDKIPHKDLINNIFLPGVIATDEDIEKYKFEDIPQSTESLINKKKKVVNMY